MGKTKISAIKLFITGAIFLIVSSCGTKKEGTSSRKGAGDTRTTSLLFLDDNTYLLTVQSDDTTYGYTMNNPVKVGGVAESSGPSNERKFLNGLLGPGGEVIKYSRAGSCCAFKTPNGMIGGSGLLDRYIIFWTGSKDTLSIYLNMYDKGDLKIPVGLTAKKK